jgi:hypothetical protein
LRNGLTAEKTYYADAQFYSGTAADLTSIESNLAWGNISAAARGLQIESPSSGSSSQVVVLKSLSASGTLFCIGDAAQTTGSGGSDPTVPANVTAGTFYNKATSGTTCPTGSAWGTTTSSW